MGELMKTIVAALAAFLFGAGGLAVINIVQERWKFRADRKAKKEDKAEEKEDKLDEMSKDMKEFFEKQNEFNETLIKRMAEVEEQNAAQSEGMKFVLLDRILYLGQSYIKNGEVSFDDRKRLGDMHTVYHGRLKGNGDADAIMDGVYNLPLKK